jgi:hypothetical protein
MKQLLIPSLAVGALALVAGQAQAASIIVDTFDAAPQSLTLNAAGSVSSTGLDASIIGGQRDLTLDVASSAFGLNASTQVLAPNPPLPGFLGLSNDIGVTSSVTSTWDNFGVANFSGQTGFLINLVSVDLNANIEFSITDSSNNVASLTKSNLTPGAQLFDFSSFVGGASISSLKSISLKISGPEAVDAVVDFIEAPMAPDPQVVPEPASVIGLGTLAGLALLKRKREANQN